MKYHIVSRLDDKFFHEIKQHFYLWSPIAPDSLDVVANIHRMVRNEIRMDDEYMS